MRVLSFILFLLFPAWAFAAPSGDDAAGGAVVLDIDGPIGPATADYLVRGIEAAARDGRRLVILRMDTPGGLDTAMRDIIQAILASPVPVATWVAPQGARAASAGTYILYASHVAAMAPATNLGAATPVSIGGPPAAPDEEAPQDDPDAAGDAEEKPPETSTAMERKVVNDAVAYIRGLAEKRGRNADWAEQAVREAVSLPAAEALERNVIDLVVADIPALLARIDGREIETSAGSLTLDTTDIAVSHDEPDWRTEFLSVITNPTVAYLLMLLGIYGLLFEGYNPGAVVPGVVGAICLLLALFAFQVLPVNYAGLALIVLGVILMAAEVFMPSFGALGIGGVAAFIIGSIILMDTDVPGFGIPLPVISSISGAGAVVVLGIVWFAVRSKQVAIVTGREEMVGLVAVALKDFDGTGLVRARGETWHARASGPVRKGESLRVTGIDGLTLSVEPLQDNEPQSKGETS